MIAGYFRKNQGYKIMVSWFLGQPVNKVHYLCNDQTRYEQSDENHCPKTYHVIPDTC
jgi:hypothetical protein